MPSNFWNSADDHGPGGHVDAQRQRVGGEDGAEQAGLEQLLDQHLELRQEPGVVHGDATRQEASEQQADLAQIAIARTHVGQSGLGLAHELGRVRDRTKRQARGGRFLGRPSTEEEVDGGRELFALQVAHHAPRRGHARAVPDRRRRRRPRRETPGWRRRPSALGRQARRRRAADCAARPRCRPDRARSRR